MVGFVHDDTDDINAKEGVIYVCIVYMLYVYIVSQYKYIHVIFIYIQVYVYYITYTHIYEKGK